MSLVHFCLLVGFSSLFIQICPSKLGTNSTTMGLGVTRFYGSMIAWRYSLPPSPASNREIPVIQKYGSRIMNVKSEVVRFTAVHHSHGGHWAINRLETAYRRNSVLCSFVYFSIPFFLLEMNNFV